MRACPSGIKDARCCVTIRKIAGEARLATFLRGQYLRHCGFWPNSAYNLVGRASDRHGASYVEGRGFLLNASGVGQNQLGPEVTAV